jgi:hypothetical protein
MVRWFFAAASAALCLLAFGADTTRYTGVPIAQVFTERDIPGSPQTRSILAHPNGLIYVGNTDGLVEYDGSKWKIIPGTAGLIVHNVVADTSGRIWYSATGEFGFLITDEKGALVAHPLHTRLSSAEQNVGHVLRMLTHQNEAYFVTQGLQGFVARADARGHVRALHLPAGQRPVSLFVHDGFVHVIATTQVFRLRDNAVVPLPEFNALATLGVHSVWPLAAAASTDNPAPPATPSAPDPGAWIVSTAGLRLWRDGRAPLVSQDVQRFLADDRVSCGCPLGDGTFALGTEKNGVLIVDATTGRILARYDDDGGLGATSSTIVALTLDADGGLWLSRFAGFTRIQVRSGATLHHRMENGVRGRVQALGFHRGRLHVATTQGVFVRDGDTGRFQPLAGAVGDTWVLLSTEDGLIVGGPDLRLIRDDGAVEIIEPQRLLFRSALRLKRDPDRLLACTGPGLLRIYRREAGHWRFEADLPNIRASLYPVVEDSDGRIWATRNRIEVVRLDWREGIRLDATLESVGPAHGLPLNDRRARAWIFPLNGSIEVTMTGGLLWRHDRARDRFVPEDRISGFEPGQWARAYPLHDGSLWISSATEDAPAALAKRTGPDTWQLQPAPYTGLEAIKPLELCDDPATNTLWMGYLGLASVDLGYRATRPPPPAVRLRTVNTADGTLLWGGSGTPPLVPFSPGQNSLEFTFAAPALQPDAYATVRTEYRTRLAGFDRQWSPWSEITQRQYSHLPPGRFSFRLQARDASEREGPEAAFDFVLLPPWWRTWWAYGGYLALACGGVAGFVRLRTRALRRRNARLERLVNERTDTLFQQNQELARLHRLELDEKTSARLAAEKSRLETLRYQLNPHFLFNSLTLIRSQIPSGLVRARDAVDRLADFCRITLQDRRSDERVPLGEEIAMLRSYLQIEHFRLGELLRVEVDLDPAASTELVPRLLLLPLVENALKYGSATSPDRLELLITAGRDAHGLRIEVANTGTWVDRSSNSGVPSLGIGHENLRERLRRHYPGAHTFTHTAADGWVRVTLRLGQAAPPPRPPRNSASPP